MADRPTPPTQPGRPRRSLGPGLTAFLVVDVLLVAVFLFLAFTAPQRGQDDPAPVASASPGDESTPDASAPEDPATSEELTAFVLPSGNIWCEMDEASATCTILQFSYEPPETPEDCDGTVGNVLTVSAESESMSFPCVEGDPPGPAADLPELAYGEAREIGEMTCQSSRNGAFCRHNPSGAGFSVARSGYTRF